MVSKRGQSAMEFLMTYGWAFLIVLIVIFSLVYFGVLDPDKFVPEKVDLQEGVDIVDASADENSISFILRNTMGRDLHDFQLNATECNDGNGTLSTAVDIPEGKTKKITVYCEHDYAVGSKFDSGLEALWTTRTSTKGERYDFDQKTRGVMKVTVNEGKELYDQVEISACGTLNLTRTIYTLQNNLTTTGTCFNVTANKVTIDLNGYNISGDDGNSDSGILSEAYNYTIVANGSIINFGYGLKFLESHFGRIINLSADSNSEVGILLSSGSSRFTIENITTNFNSDSGLDLVRSYDNNITGLIAYSNGYFALSLFDPFGTRSSSGNKIVDFNIWNCTTNSYGCLYMANADNNIIANGIINQSNKNLIYLFFNSDNNVFRDLQLYNSTANQTVFAGAVNNTMLNVTYNMSKEYLFSGSSLVRKWYYRAYVNDTNGAAVSGANVSVYDSNGTVLDTLVTGSDGYTPLFNVTQYENNGGTKTYNSNYSMTAASSGSVGYRYNYNASAVNNTLDDVITIDVGSPVVAFSGGTPINGSSQSDDYIFVNVTGSDTVSNISTFIDFNNSLVGWWRMDDVDGTTVVDYMGVSNGTIEGNAVQTDVGRMGKGFEFDGNGDYVLSDVNDWCTYSNLSCSDKTFALWFKPSTVSGTHALLATTYIPAWGGNYKITGGWIIYQSGDDLSLGYISGDTKTYLTYGNFLSPNEWHYAVVTNEGGSNFNNISLYVDGIMRDYNDTAKFNDTINAGTYSKQDLVIGEASLLNAAADFNGTIDDVMIFNRSLSAEEIAALYANTSTTYLEKNFTDLTDGKTYVFKGYAQDRAGNVISTTERIVTIS